MKRTRVHDAERAGPGQLAFIVPSANRLTAIPAPMRATMRIGFVRTQRTSS
jgi:hypothetical protein